MRNKKALKILIVITTGFSSFGGLASVMINYISHMDLDNLDIDILSGNDPDKYAIDFCDKYKVNYIKCSGRKKRPLNYFFKLLKILKSYDVIHINGNSATMVIELLAAKLANVNVRITHTHAGECEHKILHSVCFPLFKKLCTKTIACSVAAGDWIYGKNNYALLPNSIDIDKYAYNASSRNLIRDMYSINESTVVIGNVGKMDDNLKNHIKILDIFKIFNDKYNDSKLMLVGDGKARSEFEEYAKKINIYDNVIFAGMRNNVSEYLSAFDIFLFPSEYEGMPLALLEAEASGLCCIISDTIDKDVCVCDSVYVEKLHADNTVWFNRIVELLKYDRTVQYEYNYSKLFNSCFNINKTSSVLKNIYMEDKK